jgi:putative hemolysin
MEGKKMMRSTTVKTSMSILITLLLVVGLASCGVAGASGATPATETYTDPFAYCTAVGTIDAPGATYTGLQVPQLVAEGLQKALNAPDTPLSVLEQGTSWRCMDGEVYACFVGANLPCDAKANTDRTPTEEERDFCRQNRNADAIPAVVTGRETVFAWRCRDGAPEIVEQVFQPDAQGFLSDIWYKLSPTSTEAQLPNPASQNCLDQGGTLSIETRRDGGQYGVCFFEDNRQCEEWALLRGECPVGGVKVTGYTSPAAVYCAITGGKYAVTGNSGADDEQGTCTFEDKGLVCDAWAWYDGTCGESNAVSPSQLDGG